MHKTKNPKHDRTAAAGGCEHPLEAPPGGEGDRLQITATLKNIGNINELKGIWLSLQERSDYSYFQSWGWIGTWLDLLPDEIRPKLLIARLSDGSVVGLGIIVEKIAGVLRTRHAYLNQTGRVEFDSIWTEYNGFLVDSRYRREAINACLNALYRHRPHFNDLHLGGVSEDYEQFIADTPYYQIVRERLPTWTVNVEALRRGDKDYLSILSEKARYQIRRSIKLYEQFGPLTIELARTAEEAKEFLAQIAPLNKQRQATLDNASAFQKTFFLSFHDALLERRFEYGEILFFRVRAGNHTIGYLYRFHDKGRVYDYQTGFQYEDNKRYMPGYVCRVMAIRYNLDAGILVDDLMAGDEHHKARLGTRGNELLWLLLHRSRAHYLAHRTVIALRNFRNGRDR